MSPRGIGLRLGIAAGVIGAGFLAARPSAGGYRGFRQAPFAPPPWVFGPAWTAIELAGTDSVARAIEADEDSPHRARGAARGGRHRRPLRSLPVRLLPPPQPGPCRGGHLVPARRGHRPGARVAA